MAVVQTASPGVATAFAEVARAPSAAADGRWTHPEEGLSAATYGSAEVREGTSLRSVLASLEAPAGMPRRLPGPWFGAASFSGKLGPDWSGFSPLRFTLPALLAWRDGGRHLLAAFGEGAQQRLDAARAELDLPVRQAKSLPPAVRVVRRPRDRSRWNALVERALAAIRSGALDKVVLARAIDVEADAPLDPEALLAALELRYPTCRVFLVRGDAGAFLGATPEILCSVEGDRLQADALAGSAGPDEAEKLARSGKDLREHRWVVEHIAHALEGVADHVQWSPEPRVRALANVAHLHTPVVARLARGRGIADLAAALHPTPAVAGVPSAAALRFIAEHEELDRGLYAGLVGWVGDGRAELAVALRSALVRGRRARLFVGSGIVEGSSPEAEWEETEMKARALLDALGARR
jgi:salicylate biosynthesis isochorismate synthase